MTWFDWLLVVYFGLNGLATVAIIGKRREVVTPGAAVIVLVLYVALILGVLANGSAT